MKGEKTTLRILFDGELLFVCKGRVGGEGGGGS